MFKICQNLNDKIMSNKCSLSLRVRLQWFGFVERNFSLSSPAVVSQAGAPEQLEAGPPSAVSSDEHQCYLPVQSKLTKHGCG